MNDHEEFAQSRLARIAAQESNQRLSEAADRFMSESIQSGYSYNFEWMGVPIIQYPQDIVAIQELIWRLKPDVVVETGVARGGSIIFYASILELVGRDAKVIGIDVDIRAHNRQVIESHPMAKRIEMIEGSSVNKDVVGRVKARCVGKESVLVVLDSNHTHDHVLAELLAYQDLVPKGGYMVVLDTIVERLGSVSWADRPWGAGNNPMTAVDAFLPRNDRFEVDNSIDGKLKVSVGPRGYLRCVR